MLHHQAPSLLDFIEEHRMFPRPGEARHLHRERRSFSHLETRAANQLVKALKSNVASTNPA